LHGNASPFWIILLLIWANLEPLTFKSAGPRFESATFVVAILPDPDVY
jgi:hypothetical protein